MIKEAYVQFETAKLFKEKGFREICNHYYNAQYNQIRTVSDTFMMDWNDEDETALQDALWCIEQARKQAKDENDMGTCWFAERWIKSIKDKVVPQSHWKPSVEQMKRLRNAIGICKGVNEHTDAQHLEKLFNELQKLM